MNINVDRIGICEALIDTGADLSVVDLNTALNTGLEIINPDKMCSGPDGKELDIVGNIILNIKFDDKTITHQFVIMRTHLRIFILGRDFLKKMNAKIDCQREIIKYDLTENRDVIKYQQKKIKSAKDAIIPEFSIKLINAFVEAEDGEYIIEENHKMFQTNGLRLARSLINVVNKETYIWITNPYPRPLKILKNQTLCIGSQPAEVNLVEESEQKEHEEPQFQINENLAYKEKEQLKQVLERYEDLFSSGLGRSNLAKHRIDTEGAKPIKHKPYRVSAKEREIIKEQIDEMLRDGIIRPSSSPWSFPVILVKKRDGKYRFCVDYRKLNDVTVKDVYPIPRIDEVLDTLQGSKYFSAIDLKSGYWQVEVEEKDKEKTAFTTAHGLYEFNVMPFGLCNAPATFERNMENMLGNLRWQICLCYLDDVIIYSSDFSTHLKRIEAVLKCFREANLKLNNKKCQFAFEELEILGHITNQHGIKPAEHNIKAIRDFPRPKKIKEVQSFLGMCSYYRKFIKGFSKIADPLTSLIKKNVPFTWTENQEKAFQTLKVALINPPILGHFDPNAITYIHTDASNIGLGATLVQKFGDKEKVISYLSRTLSKPEQNYSTTEKECLAVVWSMSKLRPYLYGRHFKIVTDHHALCWLKNLKDPTGRLARWALKIQEYNFEIIHKSGKKHLDADGLSRGPLPENEWDEDYERLFLNQIIDEKDDFIENIKENLSGNKRSITQNFKEENGCLYKKNPNPEGRAWLLVVPKKRRKEVMSEYHNHMLNGHLGVARTTYRLKNKYYWPSMLKDVSEFVKTCHLCQSRKGSNHLPSGLLQPIPPANYPFERIGIDFVGPLPSTKRRRKWIIVLTDYYTKYAETKAVSEATVKEVSTFLIEHIILRHGAPNFLLAIETNGLTERLNRTLINMISMYVNTDQKNWDEILPFITHAYNTTIQETTGYSPFFLLFGREPMSLLDDENIPTDSNMDDYDEYIENYLDKIARTRQVVINNTEKTQERMKRNYDKKHNEKIYEPGHLVAVWTPVRKIGKCEKLLRKYFGPYRILKKLSNVNYLIEPKDNPGQDPLVVHVSRLKPYFERIDERSQDITDSPVPKSRQDSGSQGTSKQIDHCLYRKMEQGREENPKEPMESDPDSESGGSTTFPKKENTLGRTEEIAPGQEDVTPPPPVSDVLGSLARTIYQLSSATGLSRDVELPRYDGSYEAQSFFDNYDAQADLAQLHYTERLRRLPNLLQGKALHYFRSLKLDKLYYVDARQALIDLFPETTNASFARFLAIKLTDRSSLEEYYQKKTVCGLQLNLPHKILLESLTDGLPVADQRIVAAVQPNTLQAWYSVVSRVRGTHSASQVCQQTTRTTPNPSFAPSPRYSAPRPWSARPNYSANPPPSSCRYCGAMHWHAQCPKRPAQSRPRPVYRATTYPQHDRTVLSSPAPFQVNNTRAHVTRSPDLLYTTSPAQAVNPSCPMGTSTTAPKQACSDAQDSTTVNTTVPFTKSSPPGTGCSHVVNSNTLIWPQCNVPDPIFNASMSSSCISLDTSNLGHCPYNLHKVLHQFTPVFAANKYDVPKLKIPPVKINTTSDKVIALRPYRVPLNDQLEIQTQIEHMLEHGIITTSVSPYASPITLVTKRDKSKRFCVDYRRINEIIAPDVHPLPLIENILDKLSRAKYFSSADISSAYWQVEIDPSSRHLLAFVTLDGQYEFCRLPFGMRNSPQIFERAINQIFQKYKLNFIAHYFDDFIIFSDTLEEHIQHVEKFLEICQQENIKLNYKKCEFLKTSIEFLGYTVKNGTYTPQTRNLDIINAIKPPFNQKTLQSFLGAVNVYNKFIPNYARLRTPLNNLLKNDTKWQWDDKCQQAFTALKESLTRKPVLHLYQDGLPCRLYCDASTQGIAGILKQVHPDGKIHPTQYYSRALRPHERNYTISELECLAIVESIEKFRIYLSGTKFTVYSDHQALQWLKTIKNPSGRLFRWSLRLSTYDYEIQYLKGTQQHEADLLSRNPFCGFISARTIKKHQPNITDTSVAVDVNGLHTIRRKGVNRIIIPEALQHSLMNQVHSEYNHPGISQMTRLISTQYYWKGMAKSIQKFVNSCHTCQIIKRPKGKPYGTLGQIPPPQQPFDLISIDTIAGFSKYGHSKTYLHVIVDHLTRYAWAFPSKSTSTLTYIQTLKKVLQQGSPKRLLSDRAPAFTSEKFRKFLLSRGIQPLLTTSNNPQANGLIERLNATITGKLRLLYLENPKTSWTKLIKQVVQIYNQSPHTVTGFPPIFLMFNSIPPELKNHYNPFPDVQKARQLASSRTQLKHERDKQRYDKGHQAPHFEIGDLVLVKNYKHPDTGKLAPYFTGPFTIIEIISPNVVRINRPNRPLNKEDDTVHVNKLKYYTEDILFLAPQPLIPTPRIEGMESNRRKLRLKLIRLRTEVEARPSKRGLKPAQL
ncbi:hypothetical protein LAZ67_1003246 [Cordylochernes scorpioides]|uniref:RNA-directed DNA polymerase n=1 Tax=Cordylochernes scorpioides TaxID=51811 RepID=A0ABY6K085_9ARAC|nr:hypothetical protein LAZ67_1003246 [Cordylochernes scorpioides]